MRALIVDPALHSRGGHHYNASHRLRAELAALGIAVRCLGSAQADERARRELDCVPVFSRSLYGRTHDGGFATDVSRAVRELAPSLRAHDDWPDLVIMPCCDPVLAAALARVLRRHPLRPPPVVLVWLLYAAQEEECRRAFAALDAAAGALKAFCETDAMAELYRGLLPFEVGVAPGPGPAIGEARPREGGPPVVACAGFANRAKGYRLLPEAVPRVLAAHPGVRFMIHGIVDGSDDAEGPAVIDRLARLGDRVVTSRETFDEAAWLDWLGQADLVLLPYDPAVYRERGSGLFTEAARLGIPVVAPASAAFARPALDGGWGVGIAQHDAAGVAAAVIEALHRLAELRACLDRPLDRLADLLHAQAAAASTRRRPRVLTGWRLGIPRFGAP